MKTPINFVIRFCHFLVGMLVILALASCDMTGDDNDNDDNGKNTSSVTIASARYNFQSGTLTISGSGFVAVSGDANDIDVSKLGITLDGTNTLFMNTSDVEIQSSNEIRITLVGADKAAVEDAIYIPHTTLHAENAWNGEHSPASSRISLAVSVHPEDGSRWFERASDDAMAPGRWSPREGLASIVYDGAIIVMGGLSSSAFLNDLWSSSDGITWTQLDANGSAMGGMNAPWAGRSGHTALIHEGTIFIMGGRGAMGIGFNDVWASADGGATWAQIDANGSAMGGMNAPWAVRSGHTALVYKDIILVMGGGYQSRALGDVWASADGGATWAQIDANGIDTGMNAPWPVRASHAALVYKDRIILMGGSNAYDDVWTSTDGGATWAQIDANGSAMGVNAPWAARNTQATLLHNDKIFLLSGIPFHDGIADVWLSSDGANNWIQIDANGEDEGLEAPWDRRSGHSVVIHDNKLFILGGRGSDSLLHNDVWMSPVAP